MPRLRKEKFRLAPPKASCWRVGSKLWEGRADGPYAVSQEGESWIVWWSDADTEGTAARCETEAEAISALRRLADEWRERSTRKVYFIAAECRLGELVKIGVAYEPTKRLAGIQTAWPLPLRILATTPGDTDLEKRLHAKFRRSHVKGEWFRITPALKRFIEKAV